MIKRPKVWKSLGQLALAGTASAALLGGCAGVQLGGEGDDGRQQAGGSTALSMSQLGEGDEGGPLVQPSGEGDDDGGPSKVVDLKTDNVAYLTQLSLIKGHLLVGLELYKQGMSDMAKDHIGHVAGEQDKDLTAALKARGAAAFDAQLKALSDAVKAHAPLGDVEIAYNNALLAIDKAEPAGTGDSLTDVKDVVKLVEEIVREAAGEYAKGVQDGKVVSAHDYQDAYGFTQVAKQRLIALGAAGSAHADARTKVAAQLESLAPAWPAVVPPPTVKADASLLYGAAARIQIAGLSI